MTSLRNNRSWSEPPASERDCCLRVETFRLEASETRTSDSSRTEQQSRTKDSCAKRRLPSTRRSRHFLGAWLPGMAPSIPPPNWSFPRPLFVIPAPHFVILANAGIQRGGEETRHSISSFSANAGIQRGGEEARSAGACTGRSPAPSPSFRHSRTRESRGVGRRRPPCATPATRLAPQFVIPAEAGIQGAGVAQMAHKRFQQPAA